MEKIKIEAVNKAEGVYSITVGGFCNCIYVTVDEMKALIKDAEEFIEEITCSEMPDNKEK